MVDRDVTLAYPLEPPTARARARLGFRDRDGKPRIAAVDQPLVVGSAPHAGLVVDDRTVSRAHAALEPRADGLWVRDLGSRNGTFVGDVRVESARLPEGATLRLGGFPLVVHYSDPTSLPDVWPSARFGDLIGRSAVMRERFATIAKMAKADLPVLVQGETGTGKELVARAIHEQSREAGPLVVVDCGALPAGLLESELFGHVRGAFTGADRDRPGAFESAEGGTVFLDEIGELPLALQPKLLRVLESKSVRRLGTTEYRPVNVRFVSATHRDLRSMVAARSFREDLFFRLSVLVVTLPSLRERRADIPLLLDAFMAPRVTAELAPDVQKAIVEHPWPGNVRELRNFAERLRALGLDHARELLIEDPASPTGSTGSAPGALGRPPAQTDYDEPFKTFRERWIEQGERAYVARVLEAAGGNIAAAARSAGVDRTYLFRLVRKLGLG